MSETLRTTRFFDFYSAQRDEYVEWLKQQETVESGPPERAFRENLPRVQIHDYRPFSYAEYCRWQNFVCII